jgi:hypothetical protein
MQSLKQLVEIYNAIDVRIHTMYGNIIHNRWNAFDRDWVRLQEPGNHYLAVPHSVRIRQKEAY